MSKEPSTEKRAFSIAEAAQHACVSRGMIENWLRNGILSFEELPGSGAGKNRFRRIRRSDLDTFLDAQYQSTKKADKQDRGNVQLLPRNRAE